VKQKGGDPNSANWRTRTFTYNSLSQLLSAANPESGTITYTYDNDGNVLSKTSPAPNQPNSAVTLTISFCYDQLHRLSSKWYTTPTCGSSSPVANYFYDQASYNGLTIGNGIGKRTGMSDTSGATAWSYDITANVGWKTTEARTMNAVTKNIITQNNLDGSLASITYPSTRVVTFTVGTAGRLLSAVDTANSINYVTAAKYAPQGAPSSFSNGASINGALTYNKRLQPLQMYYTTGTISPTTLTQLQSGTCPTTVATILSTDYNFGLGTNDNGNVQSITNCRNTNRSQNFAYDNLNRIWQSYSTGPSWGEDFVIDPWGNLTNRNPHAGKTSYEPLNASPATNNKLTGFGYDAAGNLTQNGTATYTYDAENRLVTAGGVTYTYDGDGARVKKSSGTLYWGSGPLAESDLSGTSTSWKEYVFFGGNRIARRDASNSSVHYFFDDHLGSTSVGTNSTGATLEEDLDYYPYGGIASGASSDHYLFTGKERDSESGLDNFGARYNASTMGRFMTPDPMLNSGKPWNPQTWNRYAYALNNPLAIIDPTGLYNLVNNCAQDNKQCNKQFQQDSKNLKQGLSDLQKKVDKMKPGAEKDRLSASLKAMGTENDGNNVNVKFGATGDKSAAQTVPFYNDKTQSIGFNVTFDPSRITGGTNDWAIDAAHEGTHVSDISDPRFNDPATTLSPFAMEYRGYQTSAYAASALGEPSLSYGGGKYEIWNASWGAVDDKVLTRYITSMKDEKGNVTHPETTPHNPWP
jgi:RHS repeat-associated protein